jgi:hypothetical protein
MAQAVLPFSESAPVASAREARRDVRRMSRRGDPLTSHIAAGAARTRAHSQRQTLLDLVREHPAATSAELAALTDWPASSRRYAAARRLPELRADGFVRNGPARICRVTGNLSLTWEIAN